MSETPIIDDPNTKTTPTQPETGIAPDDDALWLSHAASRRLVEEQGPEATVGGIVPPDVDKEKKTHLNTRGKAVLGTVAGIAALGATIGGAHAAVDAINNPPEPEQPVDTVEIVVQPGDGGQSIVERGDPEVQAGTEDWRDAYDRALDLPENSDISQPGYVLKPGDTVTIPLDQPKEP